MKKSKRIISGVLAAVMALSALGAVGCGDKNNDDDNGDKKKKDSSSQSSVEKKSLTFAQIADKIKGKSEELSKAVKGDLDFAYDDTIKLTIDKSLTGDTEIKPVSLKISAKQKGKTTGADFSLNYDEKALATLKTVLDREGDNVYAQIPELSDAYAYVSISEATEAIKSAMSQYSGSSTGNSLSTFTDTFKSLKDINPSDFKFDFSSYKEEFIKNLPETKDGDKEKGDVDGVSYELSTKTVEITGEEFTKACKAVLEKAKTDENFKKIYDDYISKVINSTMTSVTGTTEVPDFASLIDQLESSMTLNDSDAKEKAAFTLYYNGEDFAGFKLTPPADSEDKSSEEYVKFVSFTSEDALVVDIDANMDSNKITTKGAIKAENNALNGTIKFDVSSNGEKSAEGSFAINNFKADDKEVSGSVKAEISVQGKKIADEMTMKTTESSSSTSHDISMDGTSLVKIENEMKKTEASDVAIPTENVCNLLNSEDLQKFQKSVDTSKFTSNLKDVLGEDLYNKFTSKAQESASAAAGLATGGSTNYSTYGVDEDASSVISKADNDKTA